MGWTEGHPREALSLAPWDLLSIHIAHELKNETTEALLPCLSPMCLLL